MSPPRTLVVTNDFPPRPGGIQAYVHALAVRLPAQSIVVYTSSWPGSADFDAEQPFPIVRADTRVLLPTPAVRRRACELLRAESCTAVWFGAAAPLGLLAGALRRAGAERVVASTHGHETAWAMVPGGRSLLRRIVLQCDVVTHVSAFTGARLAAAARIPADRLASLAPGVDGDVFRPGAGGDEVRESLGIATDRPVVACVSRLMPRKGQDVLIEAWPSVLARQPEAVLLLVGGGPYRGSLQRLAARNAVDRSVVFTGSVPWSRLPAHYDAADVFAMPCRTRLRGADVEGLGIVFLEAAATALPVVAGRSGGAPEAVLPGATGTVVDGRRVAEVAHAVIDLLEDPALRERLGSAGRTWVTSQWSWQRSADRLSRALTG